MGSLNIDISGSWYSWILDVAVWLLQDVLKSTMEEFACEKANDVISNATKDFEEAMFDQEFSLPLETGEELKVDFNPSAITGGTTCAVIAAPAAMELSGTSSTTAKPHRGRSARQARDWCSAVPGPNSGVSMILTEDVVSRIIQNLHHMDLLILNWRRPMTQTVK